jgi:hypothetical protein
MLQDLKYLGLSQSFPALLLSHFFDVYLFDNCLGSGKLAVDEVRCTIRSLSELLDLFISLVLLFFHSFIISYF